MAVARDDSIRPGGFARESSDQRIFGLRIAAILLGITEDELSHGVSAA
jgi:hypothetical protein